MDAAERYRCFLEFCMSFPRHADATPVEEMSPLCSRLAQYEKTCHPGLMQARWILIDGYSLMHRRVKRGDRLGNLMTARQRLIRNIEEVAGGLAERITVVFDSAGSPKPKGEGGGEGYESSAVEVLFSPSDKTADTLIERMVHEAPDSNGIMVVTSDRLERETAGAAGADTMSCGDFLELCERTRRDLSQIARASHGKTCGAKLGDFFPKDSTRIPRRHG